MLPVSITKAWNYFDWAPYKKTKGRFVGSAHSGIILSSMGLKQLFISIHNSKYVKSGKKFYVHLVLFTIFSALLIPITVLKAFDILMPQAFFNIFVLCALVIVPAAIIHSILVLFKLEPPEKSENKELSPRGKKILIICTGLMFGALIIIVGVRISSENSVLTNAKEQFEVNINGEITEKRIDSTLIELEKQFERLKDKYMISDFSESIRIELYQDVESLHAHTVSPSWGDAFITHKLGYTIIHIPTETPSDDSLYKSAQVSTPRPAHEIAHLIIHSKVGPDFKALLPLWFDEGIAQYESHRGFINKYRIIKRLDLWLLNIYKPNLLEDGQFILDSTKYPDADIGAFYSTSFEFVRYIDSTHKGSLQGILHRLATGETFANAFEEEIGEPVGNLYKKWYEDFF